MLKPGWLERQSKMVAQEIENWPAWMRREVGLEEPRDTSAIGMQPKKAIEVAKAKSASAEKD